MQEEVVHIAPTHEELPNAIAKKITTRVSEMWRCRDISQYWLIEHTWRDLKYFGFELKSFCMENTAGGVMDFEITYGDDSTSKVLKFAVYCDIEAFVCL